MPEGCRGRNGDETGVVGQTGGSGTLSHRVDPELKKAIARIRRVIPKVVEEWSVALMVVERRF